MVTTRRQAARIDAAAAAALKAFGILEMAEMILLELNPKDINAARQTCQTLKSAFEVSNRLKTANFTSPKPYAPLLPPRTRPWVFTLENAGVDGAINPAFVAFGSHRDMQDDDGPIGYANFMVPRGRYSSLSDSSLGSVNIYPPHEDVDIKITNHHATTFDCSNPHLASFLMYPFLPTALEFEFKFRDAPDLGWNTEGVKLAGHVSISFQVKPCHIVKWLQIANALWLAKPKPEDKDLKPGTFVDWEFDIGTERAEAILVEQGVSRDDLDLITSSSVAFWYRWMVSSTGQSGE